MILVVALSCAANLADGKTALATAEGSTEAEPTPNGTDAMMNARKRLLARVTMVPILLGGLTCSTEPDPFPGDPVVSTEPREDAPMPPMGANLNMICRDGPGDPVNGQANVSPTCPVIRWGEYVYWVFSAGDNASSMTVVAYDGTGNSRHSITKSGARYLWKIESGAGVVTLHGQGGSLAPAGRTIEVMWDELRF
jgi:hypothetical protein